MATELFLIVYDTKGDLKPSWFITFLYQTNCGHELSQEERPLRCAMHFLWTKAAWW
jgi:hypothetical protein